MHSYDFFPEDIQKEITGQLDEPTKRLSRSVSTQWHNQKAWCNDEYINDAYSLPIKRWEVDEVEFIVAYSENEYKDYYKRPIEAFIRLMVLKKNQLTTFYLEIAYDRNTQTWNRVEDNIETINVSGSSEALDIMFGRIDKYDY